MKEELKKGDEVRIRIRGFHHYKVPAEIIEVEPLSLRDPIPRYILDWGDDHFSVPYSADELELIKEAKMSKYDADTVTAIEKSIEHHEENLDKLKYGGGVFENLSAANTFRLGGIEISYAGGVCALCGEFGNLNECNNCPLDLERYNCKLNYSPWNSILNSETQQEAITAEENMVKVLKSLLEEEEEEIGYRVKDRVKIVASGYNDDYKGQIGTIIVDDSTITPYLIRLDNGGETWQKPDGIKLIKGEEMNIKRKIENINEDTTVKEWDDLKRVVQGNYVIAERRYKDGSGVIFIKPDKNSVAIKEFRYSTDQCDMGKAQIKCLMWLAKKPGKLKDNKKEIEQIDDEIESLREKKKELEVEDE